MVSQEMSGPSSVDTWPDLAVVQRWFHAVITHPSGIDAGAAVAGQACVSPIPRSDLESMITRSDNLTASERIAIYANAYYARLIECMAETFPVLKRTLGAEAFDAFVFGYLQDYPPRSYSLTHLGAHFVHYMIATRPRRPESAPMGAEPPADWSDFFIDLARLEWTVAEVFDGPGVEDDPAWTPSQSAGLQSNAPEDLVLEVAPSLRLLSTRYPVNDFYTAIRNAPDNTPIQPPSPQTSYVAVHRLDYVVRRYDLSHCQYTLLHELLGGSPMGAVLERAAVVASVSDDRFARDLCRWFEEWTRNRLLQPIRKKIGGSTQSVSLQLPTR